MNKDSFVRLRSLVAGFCVVTAAAVGRAEKPYNPHIAGPSDDGERAIAGMKPMDGFKIDLWAAEPLLANAVAIRCDEKGRVYVAEDFRIDHGVIDIRGHMDWLTDDLACRTVEERVKMLRRKMGPNFRTMSVDSERIQLLEDTKGAGKADKSTVFAEGFTRPEDGVAASVLPRGGDVYFTDIPSVWVLHDPGHTGVAQSRKEISTGYGVHISLMGHDLHGLRFGPDGKLYFSIGDRGLHVESEGKTLSYPDCGAVLRCDADGSNLELVAFGLRNPQQLIFDQYGNLFTGDNNADHGDPARWVYVVEGADSGWRIGYQMNHNPVELGPWNAEKVWEQEAKNKAFYAVPPISYIGSGPAGVAYTPGTGMPDKMKEHFFMCDFRGGANGSTVFSFAMKPKGASFEMTDLKPFVKGMLCTDIDFTPTGGVYISDWVNGWGDTGKGRIYHVYDPEAMKDPAVAETAKILADGADKLAPAELAHLLEHPDMRVRQAAQFSLASQGKASIALLSGVAAKNANLLARLHGIWGLGQIGQKSPEALAAVRPLLKDDEPEVRSQAAKVLGEYRDADAYAGLVELLQDKSPRVQFFAAEALGRLGRKEAVGPLLALLKSNADADAYVRHAAVMGLVGSGDPDAVLAAAKDESSSVRMGVLLAMRRLARPEAAEFLHDSDPQIVLEAVRAINDVPIDAAMPQLASLLDVSGLSAPVLSRVINANYRLGTPTASKALAAFAAKQDAPEAMRVAALKDLGDWQEPSGLDKIMNLWRPLPARDPAPAREAVSSVLSGLLANSPDPVRVATLALLEKLKINDPAALHGLVENRKLSPEVRRSALAALEGLNDPHLQDVVKTALADANPVLHDEGVRALARLPNTTAQIAALADTGPVSQRQAALAALGDVQGPDADAAVLKWADQLAARKVPPELQLDVLEAAAKHPDSQIQAKIQQYESARPKEELSPWSESLAGGDAKAGERIFHERADASCIRCHTVHGTGGIVGPKLDGVGSRQTREYLLESIVFPNAKIAAGFESAIVKLKNGKSVAGVVKTENASSLTLINSDNKLVVVKKDEIASRERGLSPMPEGLAKTLSKRDLRDLVEYLASLKGEATAAK